jgi:hypothetical protein
MDFKDRYPQYAPIEAHIRRAQIERAVFIAEAIASFVMFCWNEIKKPPAPAAIIIERRRESRGDSLRMVKALSHR